VATSFNVTDQPTFNWDFGDSSAHSTNQYPTHTYANPGTYAWAVTATIKSGVSISFTNLSGTITIEAPVTLTAKTKEGSILLSWAKSTGDALVEETPTLAPTAIWALCTNVVAGDSTLTVTVPNAATKFYRLRRVQ
jgi:PKD repeat protein